ncbi:TetR/AcrR family transcriptional regulator [Actinacidiphila bryophytorum]|uniref:Transcriptional regulator, TetR family n=1 Tax=Actinacidiphila bryophytorum TaxID=1436133 RepID=A0A9W4E7U9_9ACTN|nr:TetR/AcrR family transcriptional regulator [Actinacidiphila bryophytorum]MBM9438834.1 TetR/AcrR family transcriptional regulator [Actinacidiphila bryophytorum]MBN6547661.1 TetR/AcrR family transcriptional regulator [Actinacidiphila bryophytorum]CAG7615218.1 Transcriptional regulator, TetR family [Actinacidiphila bryophytorum]
MGTPQQEPQSQAQPRRSDTRRRIQQVALELFAEQGYEKTSLREIAERLDVTKAALYYHFKTKEDILSSIAEDLARPMRELIAWAEGQPHSLATKQEILRRYSDILWGSVDLFRFIQENQATVRELTVGENFRSSMKALGELIKDPSAPIAAQVRSVTALFSMHAGMFVTQNVEGDPEEKRAAILEVALDLVAQAETSVLTG